MKKVKIGGIVLITLVVFFIIIKIAINYGENAQDRKIEKLKQDHPIIEIGYGNDGNGFHFIAPPGHFINIDTARSKIQLIDSIWIKPIK